MEVIMEKQHQLEWAEAQKIVIGVDLVAAAQQQLRFLAEIDRHGMLYDGPALERAIYRYKYCWLPLLAKHGKSLSPKEILVVPLDCEWIWHCHRLSPVRYREDCNKLYGRILDNKNVVSSTQATSRKRTEEIWKQMNAYEPYELNMKTKLSQDAEAISTTQKSTDYDLVSAVLRQSPFYYQVARPHMNDPIFLEEAVARYKGFLHLIKRNQERSIKSFCVPTYDIDLIWHSHQLNPVSYSKDLIAILGRVLQHDDTDSDKSKGSKLEVGFRKTTEQWEHAYGSKYWMAGCMSRGDETCSALTNSFSRYTSIANKLLSTVQLPKKLLTEVMVEIVEARNLPVGSNEDFFVTITKKQPEMLFNGERRLMLPSEVGKKQIAVFQCEPLGELVCQLVSCSPSVTHAARIAKTLGTASISLQDLIKPGSSLSMEKWFKLEPISGIPDHKPISLRIAISFTPPALAPVLILDKPIDKALVEVNAVHGVRKMAETGIQVIHSRECETAVITSSHCGGCGGCGGHCGGSCGGCHGGGCGHK